MATIRRVSGRSVAAAGSRSQCPSASRPFGTCVSWLPRAVPWYSRDWDASPGRWAWWTGSPVAGPARQCGKQLSSGHLVPLSKHPVDLVSLISVRLAGVATDPCDLREARDGGGGAG